MGYNHPVKQKTTVETIKDFIKTLSEFSNFKIEATNNGVSTDVYRLIKDTTILYLRLSDPKENMSTEALAHRLIIEKGVSIPKVLHYEDFNESLGRSYMITTEIKGEPARNDKTHLKEITYQAGKQIALVNTILVEGFGWLDWKTPNITKLKGLYSSWEEFRLDFSRIENMLNDLIGSGTIDRHIADKYLRYVNDNKQLIKCTQAHLAHGDFGLDHVYTFEGKYSGIIDFGDIRATSIYSDLAHFYTYSPESFDDLLKGYLEVTPLEEGYKEKIEFESMLTVIGKLWWVTKNLPGNLNRRHNDFKLLNRVLRIS